MANYAVETRSTEPKNFFAGDFPIVPDEAAVLRSFGVQGQGTAAQREAAEVIAARSVEVVQGGKENGKKYY